MSATTRCGTLAAHPKLRSYLEIEMRYLTEIDLSKWSGRCIRLQIQMNSPIYELDYKYCTR